jgi:hypothetical protein
MKQQSGVLPEPLRRPCRRRTRQLIWVAESRTVIHCPPAEPLLENVHVRYPFEFVR